MDQTNVITPSLLINMDMHKKMILNIIIPPLDPKTHVFRSFKIMPRAQNAHAYVNGAFLVKFNANHSTLDFASICFGGIHPNVSDTRPN